MTKSLLLLLTYQYSTFMTHQGKKWDYNIMTEHQLFADFQKSYDSAIHMKTIQVYYKIVKSVFSNVGHKITNGII